MPLNIVSGKQQLPPRILIYGPSGVGKSTLGASIPNAVFLPTEDGQDALECDRLPRPTSFTGLLETLASLWSEEHQYTTLVLDSLSATERLIWSDVCLYPDAKGKMHKEIESFGYGSGYAMAVDRWATLIRGMDYLRAKRNVQIVLLAHSTITTVNSPTSEPYDHFVPRIHKSAVAPICEWCDLVVFADTQKTISDLENSDKKIAIGSGKRVAYFQERPAYFAKTRYSHDDKGEFTWQAIQAGITKSFNQPTQAETSTK